MVPVHAEQASERGKQSIVIPSCDVYELNNNKHGQNPCGCSSDTHIMGVPPSLYLDVRPIHQDGNQVLYWKPSQLSNISEVKGHKQNLKLFLH